MLNGNRAMRILVITDSSTHHVTESFYPFVSELIRRGSQVEIVDRQLQQNQGFFCGESRKIFYYFVNGIGLDFHAYKRNITNVSERAIGGEDVVFLRMDLPVSYEFLEMLETAFWDSKIVNYPRAVYETSCKSFLLNFKEFCAEMQLCRTMDQLSEFARKFPVVVKPLRGYRGYGIYKLDKARAFRGNRPITFSQMKTELHQRVYSEGVLAVRYLPNVSYGDKRVLVVNQQIVGAFNRIPQSGSWLANLAQGASSNKASIDSQDRAIATALSRVLVPKGVVVFGFDVIKDEALNGKLSEINTLNPGGFVEAERYGDYSVIPEAVEQLLRYANQ